MDKRTEIKPETALLRMKRWYSRMVNYNSGSARDKKGEAAIRYAISAIEKQIAKEPHIDNVNVYCPDCKSDIEYADIKSGNKHIYCRYCGQKIKTEVKHN